MDTTDLVGPSDSPHRLRRHAPGVSGFWLHPRHGTFPLTAEEHHRDFFLQHCALMGDDLVTAYESGWISVRKHIDEGWRIVCGHRQTARPVLEIWARALLQERPDESDVPVYLISLDEPLVRPRFSLKALATGTLPLP